MTEVLVGRQPIFDRYMKVFAYELLYRSGDMNSANFKDGDQATTQVILNTLMEMGLDSIVGDAKAFINLTRNFLVGKYPILLPSNRIVIEILEDIKRMKRSFLQREIFIKPGLPWRWMMWQIQIA
jgi:EAL and modified HD-GYP domain-containing signal transduction protein